MILLDANILVACGHLNEHNNDQVKQEGSVEEKERKKKKKTVRLTITFTINLNAVQKISVVIRNVVWLML